MRKLYTMNNGNGIAISMWADNERDFKLKALKHNVTGNVEPQDTESMFLASAAVIICTFIAIALLAWYLKAGPQIHEVSCHAPVDEGQKLTVRLVNVDGELQERCEYSPVGFGS